MVGGSARGLQGDEFENLILTNVNRTLVQALLQQGCWEGLVAPNWREESPFDEHEEEPPEDEEVVWDDEEPTMGQEEEPDENQRKLLQLTHEQMGHPSNRVFARTLHLGGARRGVVTWVRRHFQCDACERHGRPAPIRKANVPKLYTFNTQVHLDLVEIPGVQEKAPWIFLNCVCRGTRYQIFERTTTKKALGVWKTFVKGWVKHYGPPSLLVVDGGPEFGQEFVLEAAEQGVQVYVTNARAPWENGVAERHGGLLKRQIELARESLGELSEESLG